MKFNAGDRVRVRSVQKEDRMRQPVFVAGMEKFIGKEFTIERITGEGYALFLHYFWHEDWLEFVEEVKDEEDDIDPAAFNAVIHSLVKG